LFNAEIRTDHEVHLSADALAAIIQVARERAMIVEDLADALRQNNQDRAISLARKLCGLPEVRVQ
jgi:hypothetical protein